MENPVVDVTNCDKEPIHIPGRIQSHGFLVAIDKSNTIVHYVSENIKEKTGLEAAHVLGQCFDWFLKTSHITLQSLALPQLLSYNEDTNFDAVNPVLVEVNNLPHHMIIHASTNNILLAEFEPCDVYTESDLNRLIGVSVSRILEGKTVNETLQNAAKQVREIIRYDRVMIYKFWEEKHGEVMAEDKIETLDSFMGLHYPASDIPKQARDLYLTNLTRIITDVHADTSPLLSYASNTNETPLPLDLTHSTLRAVSPVHIQYLKNMGVAASFSVSIVSHNNRLWGLIACHNETPKFIDYKAREAARLLGQILSSSLEYRDDEKTKDATRLYRQAADALAKQMHKDQNIAEAFVKNKNLVLQTTNATGAALSFEGNIYLAGKTPDEENIKGLISWLKETVSSQIYHTENLSQQYKPAEQFTYSASGLLACMLSREMNEYILWFKPELVKTVTWAGNPNKPVEVDKDGTSKLSPRHSFAVWSEQVKNTSERWSKGEISAALKLREDVIYIINQKANQIRQLNEKLKEAYDELDTFSFTISHDLKTPITSIKAYADIILQENENFSEDVVRMLKRILKSTDKMSLLIKEVLSYSQISRKEMHYVEIDMNQLVQDVVTELQMVYKNSNTKVVIEDLPTLQADKTMIMQVFTNIISNAMKYSQQAEVPLVVINGTVNGNDILYTVKDNGIGIDMSFGNQIFEIFKRLDNVTQYEGSGVGLSIVKRIMEKHSAKIWYESEVNRGTTFYLLFVNNKAES